MTEHSNFLNMIIFLTSALICVPISKKLGMGSLLGYLIAGLAIGPFGFKFIGNVEEVMHFSEFGVVLLMFIIGLELNPKKLWDLKIPIFGMGGLQILLNTLLITTCSYWLGCTFSVSLLIGMGFSLSSTAMALQILNEKKLLNTTGGNSNFSILLFQDIAVIPMLALLPLLVEKQTDAQNGTNYLVLLKTLSIILVTIVGGRYLLRPLLRFVASLHLREIFTATALLLVMGMAFLMQSLDVSMALGAFLAGVLLAESEYRHALETDIEPFKGLLLGLFFISVGMSVNLQTILSEPLVILGLVVGIFVLKSTAHYLIGKIFKLPKSQLIFFSIIIAQVGEFAFVLFGTALNLGVIEKTLNEKLLAVVALSMLITPLVVLIYDRFISFFCDTTDKAPDVIENQSNDVIIAGFGRFGQIVGRLLHANKINATVLDYEPDQIELLRRFGFKIYYGDATRLDLLEAAGAHQAKVLVVAIDEVESNLKLVKMAREHFPHLKIFARARNVQHTYDLMDLNVESIERETFESSLKMGSSVLQSLGWAPYDSVKAAHIFRRHNMEVIEMLHPRRKDTEDMVARAKQSREDLAKMFEEEHEIRLNKDLGWD
ncbi:glutathione-regulated potassium-efflux system protein KefC [bacterium]|nr:glutathione-regulated potassium-efflux system protein KefC [bacterium]